MNNARGFGINWALLLIVLLCFGLVTGCSFTGAKIFDQMSSVEKATYLYSVYNSQYDDYMIKMGYSMDERGTWVKTFSPKLTEQERKVLRDKKKILIKVRPLIKAYGSQVQSNGGAAIPRDIELKIMELLNQL